MKIKLQVYCKGCHTELKVGCSHSCTLGQIYAKRYHMIPYYFRYKGRFVSMKTYQYLLNKVIKSYE